MTGLGKVLQSIFLSRDSVALVNFHFRMVSFGRKIGLELYCFSLVNETDSTTEYLTTFIRVHCSVRAGMVQLATASSIPGVVKVQPTFAVGV